MRSVVLRNNNLERNSEKHLKHVALAGDHAPVGTTVSWRAVAGQIYLYSLAAIALVIFFFFPPHFDLRISTVLSVAFVAGFLIMMERPVKTAATTVAPLTAILAASGVVFGPWVIILAAIASTAVRLRMEGGEGVPKALLSPVTVGQLGLATISSYGVLATWSAVTRLMSLAPHWSAAAIQLFGLICVGLAWQTVNNVFAYFWYLLNGRPFVMRQLLRTGIVASIYAYLLVATYKFGGLLTTAIFYVVVAQIKVVQDVLGITAQLQKLDRAHNQAETMVRDLIRFTDLENIEFSREVQNIAQMMGRHLTMSKKDLQSLGLAAELHEIGKCQLPAKIRKNHDLNQKEQAQQKTYTRWGGLMVRAADALLPAQIADWIEFHGEHYDGSGYPRGLRGDDIPLPSRIIAVARDYVRYLTGYDGVEAVDKEKALALLREGSGTLYDPRLVNLLYELVS